MKSLVVEDDPTSREILSHFLKPHGEIQTAANGNDAVRVFLAALDAGKPFDLVCLDIMLPEKDGQAVLREVRALEASRGIATAVRVIMTTALSDKGNLLSAIPNCDAYLVKPVDRNDLMFYLRRFRLIA
jgi:two-component system chemotaxis response regulator CheY